MHDIASPLRLAVGSHEAGSGRGCAMNLVSWENGDTTITDLPACVDPLLARVVQKVNDNICAHRDGVLLCPSCSMKVLDLAHRTVGTNLTGAPGWDRARISRIHVEIAVEQAESVLHLARSDKSRLACAITRAWLSGAPASERDLRAAAYAAYYAADDHDDAATNAAANAAYAAANAAYAAYGATYGAAADAAAYAAAYAYAYAYAAASDGGLSRAHQVIDRFEALTGVRHQPIDEGETVRAYAAMTA